MAAVYQVKSGAAEKMAEQRVEVMHGKKQLPDREKAAPLRDLPRSDTI